LHGLWINLKKHTLLFFKTKRASVWNHISPNTTDVPYVCFRSKFMVTTAHHFMKKLEMKSFLWVWRKAGRIAEHWGESKHHDKNDIVQFYCWFISCVKQLPLKILLISSSGKLSGKLYNSSKIYCTKLHLSTKQIHRGYFILLLLLLLLLLFFHYSLKLFLDHKHRKIYLH